MKAQVLLLVTGLLTIGFPIVSQAQHQPGVYASSQECIQNRPSYPGTVNALSNSLDYIEVVSTHTHVVHRVPVASAWGYANVKGQAFRLVGQKAYAIQRQQEGLVVYSRQRVIQHSRSKHVVTEYFYSETLDGTLHSLTRRGLRKQQAASYMLPRSVSQ